MARRVFAASWGVVWIVRDLLSTVCVPQSTGAVQRTAMVASISHGGGGVVVHSVGCWGRSRSAVSDTSSVSTQADRLAAGRSGKRRTFRPEPVHAGWVRESLSVALLRHLQRLHRGLPARVDGRAEWAG